MSFALKGKLKILLNFNNISLKIIMETIMTLTVKFINIEKISNRKIKLPKKYLAIYEIIKNLDKN